MIRSFGILGLALALLWQGGLLQASRYQSLQESSPFVPPDFVPPEDRRQQRPTRPEPRRDDPLDRIEFRSITIWQGTPSFSLHNPSENRSYWLEEGESEDGYRVVSFDSGAEEITVAREGRTRRITLHESRVSTASESREESRAGNARGGSAPSPSMTTEEREERLRQRAEELRERQAVRRRVITPSQD